jgi:peroxin-19
VSLSWLTCALCRGAQPFRAPAPAPAASMQDLPPELANMPPEFMAMIQKLEDDMKASGIDPEKMAQDPEAMGQMLQQMMGGEGAMQDVMSQMMSKDVLSEPMKQLEKLYPPWFGTHASELSKDELARYKKQYKIVQKLVQQFENEPDNAEKISQMMQEMHDCGQVRSATSRHMTR